MPRRSVDVTKIAPCICVSDGAANLGESGLVGTVVVYLCIQIVVMWVVLVMVGLSESVVLNARKTCC